MKTKPLTDDSGEVGERTLQDMKTMWPADEVLPDVIEYFKPTGEGWQVRMDDVLKDWIILFYSIIGFIGVQ